LSKDIEIKIYKNIILLVVQYGYETWSLTLREEHRLKISANMVVRKFGPKRDKVIEGRIKLFNEELQSSNCSPNIIKMIKSRRLSWAGHVVHMGGEARKKETTGKTP
jgi:hypothetical protein